MSSGARHKRVVFDRVEFSSKKDHAGIKKTPYKDHPYTTGSFSSVDYNYSASPVYGFKAYVDGEYDSWTSLRIYKIGVLTV